MSLYKTGTVSVTNGSSAVVGVGTAFLANVSAGDGFLISGETVYYTVLSVTDDTHLTLSANYTGTTGSGKGYQISRDWTVNLGLAEIQPGDTNWPYLLAQAVIRKLDTLIATGHKIPANLAWELKNAVGTTRLKVDEASGNVGIGTTDPKAKLDIAGGNVSNVAFESGFRFSPYSVAVNPNRHLRFTQSTPTRFDIQPYETGTGNVASDVNIILVPSGGNVGIGETSPIFPLSVNGLGAANWAGEFRSTGLGKVLIGGRSNGGVIEGTNDWGVCSSLNLQPDGGNVGIGTTAPGATLEVYGNSPTMKLMQDPNIPGNVSFTLSAAGANNTATINIAGGAIQSNTGIGNGLLLNPSGGNVGIGLGNPSYQFHLSTDSAAKPSTNTWTVASDERLKKDIVLADIDRCYEVVKALPLKRYTWRTEIYTPEQVADRSKLGWIAQDVEMVFPKAVGVHNFRYNQQYETITEPVLDEQGIPVLDEEGNPKQNTRQHLVREDVIEDCRSLNSDQIIAALYGAVQKLQAKVEALESH